MTKEQPVFKIAEQELTVSAKQFKELQKMMGKEYACRVESDEALGRHFGYWPHKPYVIRRMKVETWKIKTIDRLQIINRYYVLDKFKKEWVYMDEVVYKEQKIDPNTGKPIRVGCFGSRGVRTPILSLVGIIDPEQIKLS
jgi:hypothetical protein